MTKKLFSQICAEWRSNLWLAAELLVVSVVMWLVVAMLGGKVTTYMEPRGFDAGHCYKIMMGELNDKSPDYKAYSNHEERVADIRELVERLRCRPEVEAVSLSQNSHPYNGSNSSTSLRYDTLEISDSYCVRRLVTPDFMRVFRYTGTRGETPEQLAEMLERGEFLASENVFQRKYGVSLTSLVGKDFYFSGDTTQTFKLGAALNTVRYADFHDAAHSYSMAYDLNKCAIGIISSSIELCVRVKDDQDKDFIQRLKADSESQFRIGNIYIAEVISFNDIRRIFQQSDMNELRNFCAGISFLLLNIFLGLLGTFWFRTQQRRGEIALHRVHGARPGQIFVRLMAEGVIILTLVTLVALLVDHALASAEVVVNYRWPLSLLALSAVITYVLILLMMLIGIGIPAAKAMKVQPAEALHDE